ncbi:MAG: response regulator [Polyangiaceae bacterium]|nr:response regulator [Polyangiaceae bacterium]
MTDAPYLWSLFLEEGTALVGLLRSGLAADALPRAAELADECRAVATSAELLGFAPIARLALDCENALLEVAAGRTPASALRTPLAAASDELMAAFQTLSAPNEADRFVDDGALGAASRTLAQHFSGPPPATLDAGEPAPAPPPSASPRPAGRAPAAPPPVPPPAPPPPAPPRPAPAPVAARAPAADEPWPWQSQLDDEMLGVFFAEVEERLTSLDDSLVRLEQEAEDGELVQSIFRDLHTIKGNADLAGLSPVKNLAHAAEDLMSVFRSGARVAERTDVDLLLETQEELRNLCAAAQRRDPLFHARSLGLAARLRARAAGESAASSAVPTAPAAATRARAAEPPAPLVAPAPGPAEPATRAAAPAPAPSRAAAGKRGEEPQQNQIRVDFGKLDKLLNLVGELVLDKSTLSEHLARLAELAEVIETGRRRAATAGRRPDDAAARADLGRLADELGLAERQLDELLQSLGRSSHRLDHVTGDLRDQVMKLRMVPIGRVFRRFAVKVRELSYRHDKKVRLELVGEHTELDKMLVEQLDGPLLHLVTNAVYHGIERPEARKAAGKSPEGVIRLRAYHEGTQMVVAVEDDGGGIDPAVVRRIAAERGILSPEALAQKSDLEIQMLVFEPGFSRVAEVDEDAGRGVGTAVVWKTVVSDLKGSIELDSRVGLGTTFYLRLPLTLAIIQVLLFEAGGETFAVPLDVVRRTLAVPASAVHEVCDREVIAVEDKQVPLVRLDEVLGCAGRSTQDGLHVLFVTLSGRTYALGCDRTLRKQEVLIKSLGDLLDEVPGVMGATLIGDRCVPILEVPTLVDRALASPLGPRAAAPAGPAPAAGTRLRVLVVDDSAAAREAVARVLDKEGYAVRTADDGAEALALAEAEHFDLVTTDAMMPRLDGFELTRALRASARHRDTPIVMVTSRGETADRVRGFDAGVDAYLTKPVEPAELIGIVRSHLRHAAGADTERGA